MVLNVNEVAREFQIDQSVAKKVVQLTKRRASDRQAEEILEKVDKLIGGFGVESITPEGNNEGGYWQGAIAIYVNTGDTYSSTILYDTESEEFMLTTWGDFYEGWEQEQDETDDEWASKDDKECPACQRERIKNIAKKIAGLTEDVEFMLKGNTLKDVVTNVSDRCFEWADKTGEQAPELGNEMSFYAKKLYELSKTLPDIRLQ